MIIYSKNLTYPSTALGRVEAPIKMIIEHESDLLTKKGGVCDWLFNVEKSSKYAEIIATQNEFDVFKATGEGGGAEADIAFDSFYKYVEHIQFMKEFVVTAEMVEDSVCGLAIDAKRRAQNFTRAYYKTINRICEVALAGATEATCSFAGAIISTSTHDDLPLFHKDHVWGNPIKRTGTQSNYYYGNIFSKGTDESRVFSPEIFEEALSELSVKIRNMKDENGEVMGYTADTIILPGNRPRLENIAKKVCGSERVIGSNNNDINLHYGGWNIVILPSWHADDDRLMIMSSEANKNLFGNMFFNRIPLTITNWVDHHTGNYYWNGRCRFGVGFGSYKHILLAVDSQSEVTNATQL